MREASPRLDQHDNEVLFLIYIFFVKVRDLSHENLNPFIGACIESPNILLVWSYRKKGSLHVCYHSNCTQGVSCLCSGGAVGRMEWWVGGGGGGGKITYLMIILMHKTFWPENLR